VYIYAHLLCSTSEINLKFVLSYYLNVNWISFRIWHTMHRGCTNLPRYMRKRFIMWIAQVRPKMSQWALWNCKHDLQACLYHYRVNIFHDISITYWHPYRLHCISMLSLQCRQMVKKRCRCGQKTKEIQCFKDYLCETKCTRMKDCRKHQCKRKVGFL